MNRFMQRASIVPIYVLAFLMCLGCQTVKEAGTAVGLRERVSATVDIPFEELETTAPVFVQASASAQAEEAVRLLSYKRFAEAADAFEQIVADKPKDHRSWFGLGVACEVLGQTERAKAAYMKAHDIDNSQAEYGQAVERTMLKLGEIEF